MPPNSNSNRLIIISSSTVVVLASLASFYFIYQKKRPTFLTDSFNSVKAYFSDKSKTNVKKSEIPIKKASSLPYKTSESKQSSEFKRKREIIEQSFNNRKQSIAKSKSERPSHLIGPKFNRAQRPAKTPSKTRLNQDLLATISVPIEVKYEPISPVEQLKLTCSSLLKKGTDFQPDASYQKDLFETINCLLEKFETLDLNRKAEISVNLSLLSSFDFFKTSFPSILKLIKILLTHYSNTNENLFEKYMFNNTTGEISTVIVENLLNAFRNLIEVNENARKCLEINFQILNLLHSYIVDLDKNKNNVKRSARIRSIKLTSIRALKSMLEYFKTEINEENVREIATTFVRILGRSEAVYLPEINNQKSNSSSATIRLSRDSIDSRMELFEAYLQLVVRYLQLVIELEIKNMSTTNQIDDFYSYLMSYRFYTALDNHFKASNTDYLIDYINEIFKLVLYIRENFIPDIDSMTSEQEFEKISIEIKN